MTFGGTPRYPPFRGGALAFTATRMSCFSLAIAAFALGTPDVPEAVITVSDGWSTQRSEFTGPRCRDVARSTLCKLQRRDDLLLREPAIPHLFLLPGWAEESRFRRTQVRGPGRSLCR